MLIIQVVGFKNSGKTTLVSKLIQSYSNQGLKVASLKHHGHGGTPTAIPNTDSEKHKQAGAIMAGVEGDGTFQLSITQQSWNIEQLLAFYHVMEIDILLIEGYKKLDFDKIVLIRNEADLSLLDQVSNIKAVMTSVQIEEKGYVYPTFQPTEHQELGEWLIDRTV
jgi:molybdopterin-guanine dinucleotide biosynthesis protein B